MKPTAFFLLLSSFLVVLSALSNAPQPQSDVQLESVSASYRYGEQITFTAQVTSSVLIQQASIVISDEANRLTQVQTLSISPDGQAEYRLDVSQNPLRPFSFVEWKYRFELSDGSTFESTTYSLRYDDNRFDWQTLEAGSLKVHWYAGDAAFGQAALNAAQAGLESISALMPVDTTQPAEVFLYANSDDLRGALVPGDQDWVAGHADPALGVAMVLVEPGTEQSITMEQRIPHELMHVMMYRSVGTGYQDLPAWLREGAATLAETYPNADYEHVLTGAGAENKLIPLKELCASFPADSGQAFLAYAESRSFVNYLHDRYGSSGLLSLATSYADGLDCERGAERAFGASLSNLEQQWRTSVSGESRFGSALQNIAPYLVLLCLVLVIPFVGIISTLWKKGIQNGSGTSGRKQA